MKTIYQRLLDAEGLTDAQKEAIKGLMTSAETLEEARWAGIPPATRKAIEAMQKHFREKDGGDKGNKS